MEEMFQITLPDERFTLQATVVISGGDIVVTVTGGSRPHVGGVSLVAGSGDQPFAGVLVLPGHREDEPALAMAGRLAAASGRTVAVVAGMHWDDLTRDEITLIRKNWLRLADLIIARLESDRLT
ncbi:MAG: hypothetical protein JXO49_11725 [Deltaproteobacteria bacterium]|nr:hypothetical protein [Candidatus Anaeroferrophillus wilburensis]MBN2890001.1 hypothetical protein [Deltaproteobacteria bacterium]